MNSANPPSYLAIRNGDIFDGKSAALARGRTVLVQGDRIADVLASDDPLPDGAEIVDGDGGTLIPGLIDAHIHAYAGDFDLVRNDQMPKELLAHKASKKLAAMLSRGFTTVRDCGGGDIGLALAIDEGLIEGPQLFFCGKLISQSGGHGDFRRPDLHDHGPTCWTCGCAYSGHLTVTADGVDEVRKAVRDNLRKGASFIKFAASGGVSSTSSPLHAQQYSDEEVRAIVDEATRFGTYCTAHVHPDAAIRRAIELGVHCIEHATMISAETAKLAADRGTHIVPTLAIAAALAEVAEIRGYPKASTDKLRAVMSKTEEGLHHMKDAGVRLGFGTDLLGDLDARQLDEFDLRAKVFSPAEILVQATSNNAAILGLGGETGEISSGARADMVLLRSNPLDDLSALKERVWVMRSGQIKSSTFGTAFDAHIGGKVHA